MKDKKLKTLHQVFLDSAGVCTDTRKLLKDSLFVALRGDNFDGNGFAEEALEAFLREDEHLSEDERRLISKI